MENYKISEDGKTLLWINPSYIDVEIPYGVTTIGNRAFTRCTCLSNVIIPNSVTKIEEKAFYSCLFIREINIPNSVTEIQYGAFAHCINLKNVNILGSPMIEDSVFDSCFNLYNVNMPNVSEIGNDVFGNCNIISHIKSKIIEENLIYAFYSEKEYYNYLRRNREYKLKILDEGL